MSSVKRKAVAITVPDNRRRLGKLWQLKKQAFKTGEKHSYCVLVKKPSNQIADWKQKPGR